MQPPDSVRTFIIDQNFPWHVAPLPWPDGLRVRRLEEFNPGLVADVGGWEILPGLMPRGFVRGFRCKGPNSVWVARDPNFGFWFLDGIVIIGALSYAVCFG